MRVTGDYHMHTTLSDGRTDVRSYVLRAKELGLDEIAITDHSFCSLYCHMTAEKFDEQSEEIRLAAQEAKQVKVLHGIEANIIGEDGVIDVPDDVIRKTDILIFGFHRFLKLTGLASARRYVFENGYLPDALKKNMKDVNTQSFLGVMRRYPVDVISHLGHRTPVDYKKIAEECALRGVYLELNEKHVLFTDMGKHIGEILDTGVNFIVGTDSHRLEKLGVASNVETFVKKFDVPLSRVFGLDGNAPKFKDKRGWKNEL